MKVLRLHLKNVEKQGIGLDCAEMGKLPKQAEVNLGGEPRSGSLTQDEAACPPRRLSRCPRAGMQSSAPRQARLPPGAVCAPLAAQTLKLPLASRKKINMAFNAD